MNISIETADNGWILTYEDYITGEDNKDIKVNKKIVYDNADEEGSKEYSKALVYLLYGVIEQLGIYQSKHNETRVDIRVVDRDCKEIE